MISTISKSIRDYMKNIFSNHSYSSSETMFELIKAHDYEERFNQCMNNHEATYCNEDDARNAIWFYLRAALRGDKEAQYKLGLSYLNGQLGLDRNYGNAQKWLDQAAHQGHSDAKHILEKTLSHLVIS